MGKFWSFIVFAFVALLLTAAQTSAHRGGLNSEGCHTKRATGEYHCHRAGSTPQRLFSKSPRKKAVCENFSRCKGCGCKGGPGYRNNATGKCVGYKQLTSECGNPPTSGCTFENDPNAGVNRACVLGQ